MSNKKRPTSETFHSTADAARFVGVSRPTFIKNVLPQIPHRFAGKRYYISKRVLRNWLETGNQ